MGRLFRQLAIGLGLVCISLPSVRAQATDDHIKVTLLGTGGPEMSPTRSGYATLIETEGQKLLFDAGRGVVQRLYESRVNPRDINKIFLTHLHNDHIEGLPTLWITPWFLLARDKSWQLWGPPGTLRMVAGMRMMFSDVEKRGGVNGFNKIEYMDIKAEEIKDGVVYDRDGVKVSAFKVEHGDGDPAFGYKIEAAGRTVVLSGDTTYNANVVAASKGADLLVHNVVAFSDAWIARPEAQKQRKSVEAKLTSPDQAARVFNEAAPRMAVFSHIVKKDLSGDAGDSEIIKRTRGAGYAGPLIMGRDRMAFDITASDIKVIEPLPTDHLPDLDNRNVDLQKVR